MASSHNHKRWPRKVHACAARGQVVGHGVHLKDFLSISGSSHFSQDAGGAEADLHSRAALGTG